MLKWYSPFPNQNITDIALHYIFEADTKAGGYTLYASQSEDFRQAREFTFPQTPDCLDAYYIPMDEELLAEGRWYLKAVSDTGMETEVLTVTVNCDHSKAPLRRPISPENPLIVIHDNSSDYRPGAHYEVLPEDLKPYFSTWSRFSLHSREDQLAEFEKHEKIGYPWSYPAIFHGEVRNNHYFVPSLCLLEYILQNAKHLTCVEGMEMYMGVRPDDDYQVWMYNRIIKLCGKYGYYFCHIDGNRDEHDYPAIIKRSVYMETLKEYADYVVMVFKQNHSNSSYSSYAAILGALIGGAAKNIGIQMENWYWNDAGFRDEVGRCYGYLQGNEMQMPEVFSSQMLIPGISMGACFYMMEGGGWVIQKKGNDDYELTPHGVTALSMFRAVIKHKLIPTYEDALKNVHAAIDMKGSWEDWGDTWTGGIMRTAFQNLYGITHEREILPRQMRYFFLPVVTNEPSAFSHLTTVQLEDIKTPDDMNRALNPLYPKWFDGNAYVTCLGGNYCIMNSQENFDESQYFRVPVKSRDGSPSPVALIEGSIGLWQYIFAYSENGQTWLHCNARKDSILTFYLSMAEGFTPHIVSSNKNITCTEDLSTGLYKVTVTGTNLPAELVLCREEDAPLALTEPIDYEFDSSDFLSDHKPSAMSAGEQGAPTLNCLANMAYGRLPIDMGSMRYSHGISMPRGSSITFDLDGKYHSLSFVLGFDIDVWIPIILKKREIVWDRYDKDIKISFRAYGDGRLLYESPVMTSTDYREALELDVSGVQKLSFAVEGTVEGGPLWCAITGTPDRYLVDPKTLDVPPADVYLDLGNPILK